MMTTTPHAVSAYQVDRPLARFVVVLVVVWTGIGIVVEMVKLARVLILNSGRGPQ